MEENVFVCGAEIITVKDLSKFVLKLFDKNFKTAVFSTSLMSNYNAKKYEQQVLEMVGLNDWDEAIFGTKLIEFTLLTDSDNLKEIVGLSHKNGLIFKNEIKPFNKTASLNLNQ